MAESGSVARVQVHKMGGKLGDQNNRIKIDIKAGERDIKFARFAKITDGFVLALPSHPGVDLHFTLHSGQNGVFHLKHENKIVAQLRIADLCRDIEKLERDIEMKTNLHRYLQGEWIYRPAHNKKILVMGISQRAQAELIQTDRKSIILNIDNLFNCLPQYPFFKEILAQELLQYAVNLDNDHIKFLLAVDQVEGVLVVFVHDNNGQLIPLKFPFELSDPESTLKQLQGKLFDFLCIISPSMTNFLRAIANYISKIESKQ